MKLRVAALLAPTKKRNVAQKRDQILVEDSHSGILRCSKLSKPGPLLHNFVKTTHKLTRTMNYMCTAYTESQFVIMVATTTITG